MNDNRLLEALEEPILKQLTSVQHAFFTRYGGVSEGRYDLAPKKRTLEVTPLSRPAIKKFLGHFSPFHS